MDLDPGTLAQLLPDLLQPSLRPPVRVAGVERLKGGYSRAMWAFEAGTGEAALRPWILCADSPDGVVGPESLDRVREAALLQRVHAAGVPVPDVLASAGSGNPLGVSWFVMERLGGTAAVGPLLRDEWYRAHHRDLARQKAGILAAIHGLAVPSDLLGPAPAPAHIASIEARRWAAALAATPGARTATLTRALGWLDDHAPLPAERVTLVHGDYRTGNLLYDRSGIRGVLDWEMAHLGDPLEDVAWAQLVCWRLGTGRVGGLVDPQEWRRLYAGASGHPVEGPSLHFWEVVGSVKMSVLAWRAVEKTPPGAEHDLLVRLFHQLGSELQIRLLG